MNESTVTDLLNAAYHARTSDGLKQWADGVVHALTHLRHMEIEPGFYFHPTEKPFVNHDVSRQLIANFKARAAEDSRIGASMKRVWEASEFAWVYSSSEAPVGPVIEFRYSEEPGTTFTRWRPENE
jgi:hypothetical protein